MLDVHHVLDRYRISRESVAMATSEVGIMVRDSLTSLSTASKFVDDILSINYVFDDIIFAGIVCKYIVKRCIEVNCVVDDADSIMADALEYANIFVNNPNNSYMWAKVDDIEVMPDRLKVIESLGTNVAINASGKLKKGVKKLLALDLYKKYVVDAVVPLSNQAFISILMKELDMTKAGATTYAWSSSKQTD